MVDLNWWVSRFGGDPSIFCGTPPAPPDSTQDECKLWGAPPWRLSQSALERPKNAVGKMSTSICSRRSHLPSSCTLICLFSFVWCTSSSAYLCIICVRLEAALRKWAGPISSHLRESPKLRGTEPKIRCRDPRSPAAKSSEARMASEAVSFFLRQTFERPSSTGLVERPCRKLELPSEPS